MTTIVTLASRRLSDRMEEDFQTTIRHARMHIADNNNENVDRTFQTNDNNYEDFIKTHFNSVECSYFKKDSKNSTKEEERCFCGEIKKPHAKYAEPHNNLDDWDQKRSMKSFPTEAFGMIEFIGEDMAHSKPAEFVRISHTDRIEDVMDLLFKYWKIKIGTLAISVIGGAKNFKMGPKDKEVFTKGLVKAAQTTNALIITSGLNLGITRVVGDALQEGHTLHFDKKKHNNALCCLGISPWGYVMKKERLKKAEGKMVRYKVSNEILPKQPVSLNKNHTHYLFVDEGRRNGFANTEAGNFRASLEKDLAQKKKDRDAIPVVLVVVEGGHDVFHEASRSLKENVPLVICEGTGRASDILGEAYRTLLNVPHSADGIRHLPEKFVNGLKKKLIDQKISEKGKVEEAINHIKTIVQNESLITLFDMKTSEDLDLAILYSLIKKMKDPRATVQTSICNQIQLCLTWNRVDIAKEKIFKDNVELTTAEWNRLLDSALKNGKFQFIELFLQNGVVISDYLTINSLNDLYKNSTKTFNFQQTVQFYLRRPFSKGLEDVKELLVKMIGRCDIEEYRNSEIYSTQKSLEQSTDMKDSNEPRFRRPFQELFLWAVLMEKYECARLFWERCEDSILLCLVATKILMMIERSSSFQETERIDMLIKWKDYYENVAIKVLEECHEIQKDSTAFLIEKKNPMWGNLTCLDLAHRANDQRFISSMVCQKSIDFTWWSGLKVAFPRCFFAIFFPCLILKSQSYQRLDSSDSPPDPNSNVDSLPSKKKLRLFYSAPQTKFWIHLTIHIIFLVYFSAVVLYLMKRNSITVHEIILMTYLVGMIVDKIIHICRFRSISSRSRFVDWWSFSWWNKIDIFLIVLSLLAMMLRIRVGTVVDNSWVLRYRASKTTYSIIVGYFYLKLLRFIIIHPNLGPKMVMIGRMIRELMLYLVIILIILLAYGVTSQASYYPERNFYPTNLSNIVDRPYWTLFGELSLENTVYLQWCDDKTVDYSGPNDCPELNIIIPIIYSIYIFVANILLLNVLIAIFAHIFNEVHKNSIMVWKFNMYSLVLEYKSETLLPTPFSIIFYLVKLFKYIHRNKCCNSTRSKNQVGSQVVRNDTMWENQVGGQIVRKDTLRETMESEDVETFYKNELNDSDRKIALRLTEFEKMCKLSTVAEVKLDKEKSMESRILKIENGLKKLSFLVNQVNYKMDRLQLHGASAESLKESTQDDQRSVSVRQSSVSEEKVFDLSNSMNMILEELRRLKHDGCVLDHDVIMGIKDSCEITDKRVVKINSKMKRLTSDVKDTIKTIETILADQGQPRDLMEPPSVRFRPGGRDDELQMILKEIQRRDLESKEHIKNLEKKVDEFKDTMQNSLKTLELILRSTVR